MKQLYLIRLDDACPTMDRTKWRRIEELLDRFDIKPMVGIIPHNEDPQQMIDPEDETFWLKVAAWKQKGWVLSLHGYNHCYISCEGRKGLNPMWCRSEFAGLPINEQREKVRLGVATMRDHGVNPLYFFAPSHTFDENTLQALRMESDIRIVSDTIGRYPYKKGDFWFIPQITGHCMKMPFNGIFTFCIHPNTTNETAFEKLESFLIKYHERFISFNDINLSLYSEKKTLDKLISWSFFRIREFNR